MKKDNLLTLTDEQVELIVAAQQEAHLPPKLPRCPEFTTLACGEEGICSAC